MKKLLSMFLALGLFVSLVGCGGSEPKPKDTVISMFEAYKAQDFVKMSTYVVGGDLADDFDFEDTFGDLDKELVTLFMDKLCDIDYTIGKETIDGDNAVVEVTLTANNIGDQLEKGFDEAFTLALSMALSEKSEEEIEKAIYETMFAPLKECEKNFKNTIELDLVKDEDGKWLLEYVQSDEFTDTLTGGLMSFFEELEEE